MAHHHFYPNQQHIEYPYKTAGFPTEHPLTDQEREFLVGNPQPTEIPQDQLLQEGIPIRGGSYGEVSLEDPLQEQYSKSGTEQTATNNCVNTLSDTSESNDALIEIIESKVKDSGTCDLPESKSEMSHSAIQFNTDTPASKCDERPILGERITLDEARLALKKVILYLESKPGIRKRDLHALRRILGLLIGDNGYEYDSIVPSNCDSLQPNSKQKSKRRKSKSAKEKKAPVQESAVKDEENSGNEERGVDDANDMVGMDLVEPGDTTDNTLALEGTLNHEDCDPFEDMVDSVKEETSYNNALNDEDVVSEEAVDVVSTKSDRPHVCGDCSKRFKKARDLKRHRRVHTGEKPYPCPVCDKWFADASTRRQHIRTHTGEKPYQCPVCGKSFSESRARNVHVKVHGGGAVYQCSDCDKSFSQSSQLTRHTRQHKHNRTLHCHSCDKYFRDSSSFHRHMRLHTGELPYKCEKCEKRFATAGNYTTHIKIHTGDMPYKCDNCDSAFLWESHLERHKLKHNQQKPEKIYKYKCSHCPKVFTQQCNLQAHVRTHTGEKPYQCSTCGKVFNHSGSLNIHMRTHTGERPYGCHLCEKSFTHAVSLQTHIRTHTGERPYVCATCGKGFAQSGTFRRHTRLHTGEKPYECTMCGACFNVRSNLGKHMKVHGITNGKRQGKNPTQPTITPPPGDSSTSVASLISLPPPVEETGPPDVGVYSDPPHTNHLSHPLAATASQLGGMALPVTITMPDYIEATRLNPGPLHWNQTA